MGSSFPSANALARIYIWLEVAPAASSALATTSQLRTSVDICSWIKDVSILANPSGAWWQWNPPHSRTYKTQKHLVTVAHENPFDERMINYRLRIDRWTRSVALQVMDPTRGISSLHLDGRQGLFSSNHTLAAPNQQRIYLSFTIILHELWACLIWHRSVQHLRDIGRLTVFTLVQ